MAMLHSLWQKISGKHNAAGSAITQPSPFELSLKEQPTVQPTLAAVPDQYVALWQLHRQRQFLEVKVEGSSRSFHTLIVAMDIPRGILWLDDLFPSQNLLEIGDIITLRHHRNGEQVSFSSPIVAWGSHYEASGLAVILPAELQYQPRRQSTRCDLSHNKSLSIKIRPIGHNISYGNVQDLSVGGVRFNIAGNLLGQLRHGALLPMCELELCDELVIRCSARIRAFRMLRAPHRCTQISIEFVDLTLERKLQLQQFLNNLGHIHTSSYSDLTLQRA
jgi:c-di-GMP-binding flagellar brake protein YcgR